METIKNLITRFGATGALFLGGFILILYIALGFLYFQQGAKQTELQDLIVKLGAVVARPLASPEELQDEYNSVNSNLATMSDSEAISLLVGIAEKSGIDVSQQSDKFVVPPATYGQAKVGEGTYQVVSFRNIHVQGDHDSVMNFISALDSGTEKETMVLQRVVFSRQIVQVGPEERERSAEFGTVAAAVKAMMSDNNLAVLPHPMAFANAIATNFMGDDPASEATVEGFPDIATTAAEKGYTGNLTPRGGYVLYEHDKIPTDNTTEYQTVSYLTARTTKYYYTCEADGTVRQWDGPNVLTAVEYRSSGQPEIELQVEVDVDIYTKL